MHKQVAVLLSLLLCTIVAAGCITINNAPPRSDDTTQHPQTYNVTGKNFTLMAPKVGQWVRYRVIAQDGSETLLTYTITGKSDDNFTINTTTRGKNTSQRSATATTVEARYDPKEASLIVISQHRNVEKLFALFFNASEVNTHKLALQDVNVAYGNLTCVHSRIGAFDIWMNEDVPVTGLVKCVAENQYVILDALNKSGSETSTS